MLLKAQNLRNLSGRLDITTCSKYYSAVARGIQGVDKGVYNYM